MGIRLGIFSVACFPVIFGTAFGIPGKAVALPEQGYDVSPVQEHGFSMPFVECQLCQAAEGLFPLGNYTPPNEGAGSGAPDQSHPSGSR